MAKKFHDQNKFPASYQYLEFKPEFETLKDKKENSIRAIAACQTLLIDTAVVFSSVPAKNQRVAICEMLLKTSEKLREFLLKNLNHTTAFKVDLNIITTPTNTNLSELSLVIKHYLELIRKDVNNLNSPKPHDNLFMILTLINQNLQCLIIKSRVMSMCMMWKPSTYFWIFVAVVH